MKRPNNQQTREEKRIRIQHLKDDYCRIREKEDIGDSDLLRLSIIKDNLESLGVAVTFDEKNLPVFENF
jgi:hypothetical protein